MQRAAEVGILTHTPPEEITPKMQTWSGRKVTFPHKCKTYIDITKTDLKNIFFLIFQSGVGIYSTTNYVFTREFKLATQTTVLTHTS